LIVKLKIYVQKAKEDDWMEYVSCRNWLHESSSPYKHECVDCIRKLMRERGRERGREREKHVAE
jgi:hypothetical protein